MASCGGSSKHAASESSARESIPAQGPLPTGVVAAVQSTPITAASFRDWFEIAYNEIGLLPGHHSLPSPPAYATCVTTLRALSKQPSTMLRSKCEHNYGLARTDAIGFLIRAQWLLQEASAQHVNISSSTLNKAVAQAIKQQYPQPSAFQTFLAKTGMTRADFSFRVRLNTVADTLQSMGNPPVTVSAAQVAHYYRANMSQYLIPPSLTTLMLVTHTQASALKARAALLSGESWAAVANRYSVDSSKKVGGEFAVVRGQQDPNLEHAAFSAPRGRIEGPVRARQPAVLGGGSLYYVFKVTGGTSGSQKPLSKVAPEIKQTLTQRGRQQSLTSFVNKYRQRWKARTRCRAGYVIPECRNGGSLSSGTGI
jgi:foldase protein PrsA